MGFAWLCAALFVLHFFRRFPAGELDFDGERWYFADKVGTVSVHFDGQVCMLLRFDDDLKQASWLWVEARNSNHRDSNHWLDLRRAVYSRAHVQNLPNVI